MKFILLEILKANIVVLIIYFLSFLIEKITPFRLLWWNLRHKKNKFMANGAANVAATVYFLVNIIVLFKDLRKYPYPTNPEGYSFILWLCLVILLTILFRKFHFALTPIDPDRDNLDWSD
jgi:hypothetical protein